MKYSLGIDFGTNNAVMAVANSIGQVMVLRNKEGKVNTPSVIYFDNDDMVVGDEAKELQVLGEGNIAFSFKRNIGNQYFKEQHNGKQYKAEEFFSLVIKKLKEDAELRLNTEISKVVITVPGKYKSFQREAIIKASKNAGFQSVKLLNETTATAIAYSIKTFQRNKKILIYDLGAGTFEVALVNITLKNIEILATEGTTDLGSNEWDERIALYLVHKFNEDHGIWLLDSLDFYRDLLIKAEKIKKQLTIRNSVEVNLSYAGEKGCYKITRQDFERLTEDLLNRTLILTKKIFSNANFSIKDVNEVILVGCGSKMPMVMDGINKLFGKISKVFCNLKESVAIGAAIHGSTHLPWKVKTIPTGRKVISAAVHGIGIISVNEEGNKLINKIVIPKDTRIPVVVRKSYKLATKKHQNNYIEIYVLQGDNESLQRCTIVGKYIFTDIKHITEDGAIIDIEYSYTEEEIINLRAYQRETGKVLSLKIKNVETDIGLLKQELFIR
ncbi:Hsp70 family protein [Clostridium cellulovorans]|uniref:Heat shock protein 70 n=1 Tax=Clostridium cellulovorans (strain ATCC 35296 / DSM 3052 / OCM 3 / 743B) TaxID=573061 RepID=D9SVA9_CLOC7|nr:Hsp70 family protein [Clostridium cellulovorans]ADL51033.1 Heat shock protein 70 [Clostridium cellulovorans 743B]